MVAQKVKRGTIKRRVRDKYHATLLAHSLRNALCPTLERLVDCGEPTTTPSYERDTILAHQPVVQPFYVVVALQELTQDSTIFVIAVHEQDLGPERIKPLEHVEQSLLEHSEIASTDYDIRLVTLNLCLQHPQSREALMQVCETQQAHDQESATLLFKHVYVLAAAK